MSSQASLTRRALTVAIVAGMVVAGWALIPSRARGRMAEDRFSRPEPQGDNPSEVGDAEAGAVKRAGVDSAKPVEPTTAATGPVSTVHTPATEVFRNDVLLKIRAYLELDLRDYVLTGPDSEAMQKSVSEYLKQLDDHWYVLNRRLYELHDERRANGSVEIMLADQRPDTSADGVYVKTSVRWDEVLQKDVREVSRIAFNEDNLVLREHTEMSNLKAGLLRLLRSGFIPERSPTSR